MFQGGVLQTIYLLNNYKSSCDASVWMQQHAYTSNEAKDVQNLVK